jgi:hypothetical protein
LAPPGAPAGGAWPARHDWPPIPHGHQKPAHPAKPARPPEPAPSSPGIALAADAPTPASAAISFAEQILINNKLIFNWRIGMKKLLLYAFIITQIILNTSDTCHASALFLIESAT